MDGSTLRISCDTGYRDTRVEPEIKNGVKVFTCYKNQQILGDNFELIKILYT